MRRGSGCGKRTGSGGFVAQLVLPLALLAIASAVSPAFGARADPRDLADLSLEELSNIDVTSVSKRPEQLTDAPASIYVITGEDIRRSGVTTLPEALRLAPNLQVARIDSVQYAISARGFNNAIGNKLLVLVDGRTVYTPLFSGVFWDQQDVLLEDVERIEVISGPGATLWGANAVNGVINVITRPAGGTQGSLVWIGGGTQEQHGAARYGSRLGQNGHLRIYGKGSRIGNTVSTNGTPMTNDWDRGQAGFRADWATGRDSFTFQGDAYHGSSDDRGTVIGIAFGRIEVSGANLLARWTRQFDDDSDLQIQAYWDRSRRDDLLFYKPEADIFDLDFQHSIRRDAHRLLWGGGYRHGRDDVGPGFVTTFVPESEELGWSNLFVQDQIRLSQRTELTVGVKLESNDYTGLEYLPSARIAWKPTEHRLVWGAVSRAVRAPSRFDRDVRFPGTPPFLVVGGPNFQSEVAYVYELGYRSQPSSAVYYSVTTFYHDWDRLRSGTALPVTLENEIEGHAYGVEAWGNYQATSSWRLSAGLTTLRKDLRLKPGSTDPVGVDNDTLSNDPEYQWQLRSYLNLPAHVELDVGVRHVAALRHPAVPAYTALDVRVGWRPRPDLELSLTGQNLLDQQHPEFGAPASRSELFRSVLGKATWHF
jgi:iron complex outermembrane receptor protein